MPGVVLISIGPEPVPKTHRRLAAAFVAGGRVAERSPHAILEPQAATIAERHALPAARLTDDGKLGAVPLDHVPRAFRIHFFLHRADDDKLPTRLSADACDRIHKSC